MIVLGTSLVDQLVNVSATLRDPRNVEAADLISQIVHEQSQTVSTDGGTADEFQLYELTPYLKTYLFMRHHPWVLPVVGGLAFVGVLTLMYKVGGRSCERRVVK